MARLYYGCRLTVPAIGLSPISYTVSCALMKVSLRWVFIAAGGLMALFNIAAGLRREIREMGESESQNDQPPPVPYAIHT